MSATASSHVSCINCVNGMGISDPPGGRCDEHAFGSPSTPYLTKTARLCELFDNRQSSAVSGRLTLQERVQFRHGSPLAARHQVAVAVEGGPHVGVADVDAQLLRVQARRDQVARRTVASLV